MDGWMDGGWMDKWVGVDGLINWWVSGWIGR